MGISGYIAALRTAIGTDLLLVPTATVLPRDALGRILLVRHRDTGQWATIGGSVEPDESPDEAARREAQEEAGVVVKLRRLLAALGGPQYRITYPNGDQLACVAIVYEATVESGNAKPDGDETVAVGWFHPTELTRLDLDDLNCHLLNAVVPLLPDTPTSTRFGKASRQP